MVTTHTKRNCPTASPDFGAAVVQALAYEVIVSIDRRRLGVWKHRTNTELWAVRRNASKEESDTSYGACMPKWKTSWKSLQAMRWLWNWVTHGDRLLAMNESYIGAWKSFVLGCEQRAAGEREHAKLRRYLSETATSAQDVELLQKLADHHLVQAMIEDELAVFGREKIAERATQLDSIIPPIGEN